MREEIISFETAKVAKEKGFGWFIGDNRDVYFWGELHKREDVDWNITHPDFQDRFVPAPTQSLLQRWLREVHNIIVDVIYDENSEDQFEYLLSIYKDKLDIINSEHELYEMFWDNYEEALEEGLQKALELI